jgi:hypothetical protein
MIEYRPELDEQFLRYGSLLDLGERLKQAIRLLTLDSEHYQDAPTGILLQTQFLLGELGYLMDDVRRKAEDEKTPSIESRGYNPADRGVEGWSFVEGCDCDGDCSGGGGCGGGSCGSKP